MESTGKPDHIQCSQATADLLIAAGKTHWVTPRDHLVVAKGKGEGEQAKLLHWRLFLLKTDVVSAKFKRSGSTLEGETERTQMR